MTQWVAAMSPVDGIAQCHWALRSLSVCRTQFVGNLDAYVEIQCAACALSGEGADHGHRILRMGRGGDSHMGIRDRLTMRGIKASPSSAWKVDLRPGM